MNSFDSDSQKTERLQSVLTNTPSNREEEEVISEMKSENMQTVPSRGHRSLFKLPELNR